MRSSQLAERIANEISRRIASNELGVGSHLGAQMLADDFGVSRSPIREALNILADAGLAEQKANRGFYVVVPKIGDGTKVPRVLLQDHESPYQRMANDWRQNLLPEEVTEQFLRDRYELTKAQIQDVLVRAAREGWIERKPGYGWRFINVAKSPESFQQIYQFRMLIEPAAMLSPDYSVDREKLEELKATQQRMLDHDIAHLPAERLVATGAQFHEELIKFSGNTYLHMSLVRVNQMRRLLEYRAAYDPKRFFEQSRQHLWILDLLSRAEILEASFAMKKHLAGALDSKSKLMRDLDSQDA